ncbi:hypothetical protein PGN35_017290 [Nodosilinea sp. PGN35]|uniref:hypothetical protein n=1 Tax=Nodosilinea sp. PGN35 TaxID=3020489 RepID=UPI0023B35748|nr:hypothetical protein [Nodosilinea sp. TSF1-S3]MDF0369594.1 hypothetical protein [Nodosilinea sp. TSF1-S3]
MHPLVIQESLVYRFRYWNETVQEGMYFNNDLYTYFQAFPVASRLTAYATAYEQIQQGNSVCITVSESRYILWLCLRTPTVQGSAVALSYGEAGNRATPQQEVGVDSCSS